MTDNLIGKEILGYTVEKELGKGGYAKVYRVSKMTPAIGITSECALKVITLPTKEEYLAELENRGNNIEETNQHFDKRLREYAEEIEIMKNLSAENTKHIVRFHEYHLEPQKVTIEEGITFTQYTIFILMELLTDFRQYCQTNNLTVADVIRLGKEVLIALDVCHQNNIIHRDVKEKNILVDAKDNFKLADFGVSKQLDEVSLANTKRGTWLYMAPEIILGKPYDTTVDLYSLGVVLYRQLNNLKPPFSIHEISVKLENKMPPLPLKAPKPLGKVISKAINPRQERFNSALEFLKALEKVEKKLSSTQLNQKLRHSSSDQPSPSPKLQSAKPTPSITVQSDHPEPKPTRPAANKAVRSNPSNPPYFKLLLLLFITIGLVGLLALPQSPLFSGRKSATLKEGTYEGEWILGFQDGKGTMTYSDGSSYTGEWSKNLPHGRGKIINTDGSIYEGEWVEGKKHGQGSYTYANGDIYEGEWLLGFQDGKGTMTYSDGSSYTGEWVEGKKHGQGRHTYANGDIYDGEFKEGEEHGLGIYTKADGTSYEGEFEVGKIQGKGKMIYADGNIYKGEFKDNERHGKGKMLETNGNVYEGEFVKGWANGIGKLTYADGRVYEGEFTDGIRQGDGKLTYPNGNIYVGEFSKGEFHGKGKITYSSGDSYEGEFKEGMIHGKGKFVFSGGQIIEGNVVPIENTNKFNVTDTTGTIWEISATMMN